MQRLFISIMLYISSTFCLYAQDDILTYIEKDKKEFFRNNGWELYYASDNIKFYDYVIQNSDLVIAERVGYNYIIHFLNESRLIEKSKTINGSGHAPGLAKLYIDQDNIALGPIQKFECRIIPEKERVERKGRLKNWNKRRRGEYFKKYLHYGFFTFYSFASYDSENGIQKVEVQFGENNKNLSTLYVTELKSEMLSYSNNAERVEIEFLDNQIFLVDNFHSKFLVFDLSGNKLSEIDLSIYNDGQSGLFNGALLRKDQVHDKLYLIFRNKIYQVNSTVNNFKFDQLKLKANFSFYKSRVYDNFIYNLFTLKDGRVIYRKKLE